MASCDRYVYDLSSEQETDNVKIFMSKQWVSLLDQSQGNYASNVSQLQTDVLTNSSTFVNMQEAVLLIPMIITVTQQASTGTTFAPATTACDYAFGLKNSILAIIHQLSVMYNNVTLTQNMPYISLWNVFKLQTSMNYTDISLWATLGFYPDTLTSVSYSATPFQNGAGTCNNVNYLAPLQVAATTAGQAGQANVGLLQRQLYYGYNPANTGSGTFLNTQCSQIYKSYIPTAQNSGGGKCGTWNQFILGSIRLADLHDVFASCPLIKGSYWTIRLGLNNTAFNFSTQQPGTGGTAGIGTSMWCSSVNSAYGGVNPLMVASTYSNGTWSSGGASLVYGAVAAAATPYRASIYVGGNCLDSIQLQAGNPQQSTMMKQVTLIAPTYVFSPDIEMVYIEQGQKTISYTEIFQYTVSSIPNGQSFNNVLTSGIAGLKELLIIPMINGARNNIGNTAAGATNNLPQFQSPFDCAGAGVSGAPEGSISNFNVQVAGQNYMRENSQYIYQTFYENFYGQAGQINGGQSAGINNCLLNELDYFSSPFIYVNIGRGLASDDLVLKSVQITGLNNSSYYLDLYCFLTYTKTFTIDIRTGALV